MKWICAVFCLFAVCSAQSTLIHDGLVREYYVSYPANPVGPCPLIINMHGFGGDATGQQQYSELDDYALPQNIAVVYPEGINNAWNVGTNWDNTDADDVGFINSLIDSVAADYDIDLDRVYACGMSNGGFMAYELACELSHKIAAFGSVTGNLMLNTDQDCEPNRDIPIMHIHGTADVVVPYDSSRDGSLFVAEAIEYWRDQNDLDLELIESVPDTVTNDQTTVDKFTYYNTASTTQFVHYRVNDGGHQWFGSTIGDIFVWFFGYNNHDIHASEELVNFFLQYRLSDFLGTDGNESTPMAADFRIFSAYPNPFNPATTIPYELDTLGPVEVAVFDMLGRKAAVLVQDVQSPGYHEIQWFGNDDQGRELSSGIYFIQILFGNQIKKSKVVYLK